jgi:uncharacterized protein YoxC
MATETELIQYFHAQITEVDGRMSEERRIGGRIAARTNRIIHGVLWLLVVVAVVVLYLIRDLSMDMVMMTQNMESMYGHFAGVSRDMRTITGSVTSMNGHVRSLPNMKQRMVLMSQDMASMNQSVQGMHRDVSAMDQNVTVINGGVNEMANRFDQLTRATQGMGYNVNQMSQPVRSFNPLGFFGR